MPELLDTHISQAETPELLDTHISQAGMPELQNLSKEIK